MLIGIFFSDNISYHQLMYGALLSGHLYSVLSLVSCTTVTTKYMIFEVNFI